MDPSVLQLFSTEQILDRLAETRSTGCLHVFTPRESANIFFKEGLVAAAAKGLLEGEEVLKQILEWKETRFSWQPDAGAPIPPLKALELNLRDFLARQKPDFRATGKTSPEAPRPPETAPSAASAVIAIPSRGTATGPLDLTAMAGKIKPSSTSQVDMAATKNINASAEARSAHDEALLNKHRLVLVSVEHPDKRLKLARISNLIGRNPACDIPIPHPSISRQHCLLQITERGLHVKDLDTTNGTTVNGIVLTEGYINVGDKLTIGHLGFILEKT